MPRNIKNEDRLKMQNLYCAMDANNMEEAVRLINLCTDSELEYYAPYKPRQTVWELAICLNQPDIIKLLIQKTIPIPETKVTVSSSGLQQNAVRYRDHEHVIDENATDETIKLQLKTLVNSLLNESSHKRKLEMIDTAIPSPGTYKGFYIKNDLNKYPQTNKHIKQIIANEEIILPKLNHRN